MVVRWLLGGCCAADVWCVGAVVPITGPVLEFMVISQLRRPVADRVALVKEWQFPFGRKYQNTEMQLERNRMKTSQAEWLSRRDSDSRALVEVAA